MRKALLATLCILSFAVCSVASMAAAEYKIIDLGIHGGIVGINNRNQVIGTVGTSAGHSAFIWDSANGIQELGTLGGANSEAMDINDAGQVLGYSQTETGEWREFVWDRTHGMQAWEHPSIPNPCAVIGINNSGQICGSSGALGSFVWDSINGLYSLGHEFCGAEAINNKGQITGLGSDEGGEFSFIWDSTNGTQRIPQESMQSLWPSDINDSGQVVGDLYMILESETLGFVWDKEDGMTVIGVAGGSNALASGINNNGDVVGSYYVSGKPRPGYIWNRENGMFILPTLDNLNAEPQHINDSGWITGFLDDYGTSGHRAVIWQPVPEPGSFMVLSMGIAAAFCSVRKRVSSTFVGRRHR